MTTSTRWRNAADDGMLNVNSFAQGDFITWQVKVPMRDANGNVEEFIYDYGAIRSRPYHQRGDVWMWHITGNGLHYGTAIVDDYRIMAIVDDKETSGVWVRKNSWEPLKQVSPF